MKAFLPGVMLCFFGFTAHSRAQVLDAKESKLQEIRERASLEPGILTKAVSLPGEVAIPFLSRYLWFYKGEKGPYFDTARKAITTIPDYEKYFAAKLITATQNGTVDDETFELLSLIGTPQAASVIAPYLFDFAETPAHGDIRSNINALSAVLSLGRMSLPDAPTDTNPDTYKSEDILAWQKWAINRKFVSSSKTPGVPNWLVALWAPALPPQTTSTASVTPVPLASPETSLLPLQKGAAEPNEKRVEHRTSAWPWAVGGLVLLITALFVLKRSN